LSLRARGQDDTSGSRTAGTVNTWRDDSANHGSSPAAIRPQGWADWAAYHLDQQAAAQIGPRPPVGLQRV